MRAVLAIVVAGCALSAAQPPAAPSKPTGIIRGRILLPSGRPARRALIRILAPTGGFPQTATADDDGRYEIKDVAAGDYRISAGKPGYVALEYGQRRAFERGSIVTVRAGEAIERIDIMLQPTGAVSGRVVDENGDPIEGAQVRLMELLVLGGRRQLMPVAGVGRRITNDQGRYRLYGVPPGRYAIVAGTADPGPNTPTIVLLPYLRTYFPGTARPADARFVTIGLSQEIDDVDIPMVGGTGAKISGTIVDAHGKPVRASVFAGTSQRSGGVGTEPIRESSREDGTFAFDNLPPGEYVLQVMAGGADVNAGRESEFAARFVTVAEADVSDVNIRTSAGSRVEGRIVFDGGGSTDYEGVTLNTAPADFDRAPLGGPSARATAHADGSFLLEGLNGPRRFHVMRAPTGWSLKSVRANGRDVTDDALSFGTADESLTDVEVVLTNLAASIGGTVADAQGRVITDYTAIVFATASDRWYLGSRFLGFTRPKPDGSFSVPDLPPGDYYVAAVDRMQGGTNGNPGETQDPAFLESLIPRATRITLSEGQAATVALRVIVR